MRWGTTLTLNSDWMAPQTADAPAYEPLPVASVRLFLVGHLVPVAGDVYVFGIELDERSYVIQEFIFGHPFQGRDYLK